MHIPKAPEIVVAGLAMALVAVGSVRLARDRDAPAVDVAPTGTDLAIAGFQFGPTELAVRVGDTVTWTSSDDTQHTVTGRDSTAKAVLDSESIRQAGTYEATFEAPGAYEYFCVFHPNMQGTITVEG